MIGVDLEMKKVLYLNGCGLLLAGVVQLDC